MPIYRRPKVCLEINGIEDFSGFADHPAFLRQNVCVGMYQDWRYRTDGDGYRTSTVEDDPANHGVGLANMMVRAISQFAAEGVDITQRLFSIWQAFGLETPVGSFGGLSGVFPVCSGLSWNSKDKPGVRYKAKQHFRIRNVGAATSGTFDLRIRIGSTDYDVANIPVNVSMTALQTAVNIILLGSGYTIVVSDNRDVTDTSTLNTKTFHCGFYSGGVENLSAQLYVKQQTTDSPAYVVAEVRPWGEHWTDYTFPYPYPRNHHGIRENKPRVEAYLDAWETERIAQDLPICPLFQIVSEGTVPELVNEAWEENGQPGWLQRFMLEAEYISTDPADRLDGVSVISNFIASAKAFDGVSNVPAYTMGVNFRDPVQNEPMDLASAIVSISMSMSRKLAVRDLIRERYSGVRLGEYSVFGRSRTNPFRYRPTNAGRRHHMRALLPGHDCHCPDMYIGPHEWYDQNDLDAGRGDRQNWAAHYGVAEPSTSDAKQALNATICKENLANLGGLGNKLVMPYFKTESTGGYYSPSRLADIIVASIAADALDGFHWFIQAGNSAAVIAQLDVLESVLQLVEGSLTLGGDGSWPVSIASVSP